jgi:CBS domain-containing protein
MTPFPYSVDIHSEIEQARSYMDEHEIHHLPVVNDGEIVGILDKQKFEDKNISMVNEIVFDKPHVFDLNERLDNILELMSSKHIDTILVTRHDKLVGIFTITDACRKFSEYLREEFGPSDGNSAA